MRQGRSCEGEGRRTAASDARTEPAGGGMAHPDGTTGLAYCAAYKGIVTFVWSARVQQGKGESTGSKNRFR